MRANGVVRQVSGLGDAAHVCCVYNDPEQFRTATREFVGDGLRRGDRLLCIGDDHTLDRERSGIAELTSVGELVDRGGLQFVPLDSAYGASAPPLTPQQRLKFYDLETRRAVADGYRGLRVIAEVTPVVFDGSRRANHVQWEHLVDDYIAHGPGMSALCGYLQPALDHDLIDDVTAVHPAARRTDPGESFRIYFDDGRLILAGVADSLSADRLDRLLMSSHRVGDEVITIDLHALEFIDGRACAAIANWANALNILSGQLRIAGASRIFRRVWDVLGFDELDNTSFAEAVHDGR